MRDGVFRGCLPFDSFRFFRILVTPVYGVFFVFLAILDSCNLVALEWSYEKE